MQYVALACDYDGTLATNGVVPKSTVDALHRLHRSGRKLMLVTGRETHQWRWDERARQPAVGGAAGGQGPSKRAVVPSNRDRFHWTRH
jgi:hypothetical protein